METIARIRWAHFVRGKSIKAICRELRVSRKVVRKVLRSDATEFRYARDRQPMPRLGAWRRELNRLLDDMLVDFSCEVVGTASRVEEALGVIGATTAIDAAVLDVNLHGTRSDPVADALAACGITVVFATGYGGDRVSDAHRDRPVLQKPFRQADLAAALTCLLADSPPAVP